VLLVGASVHRPPADRDTPPVETLDAASCHGTLTVIDAGWMECEQMRERKNDRKNRKIAESTLQQNEEWRSEDNIAGVDTTAPDEHDDMLCVGIAA
jgi:hypothetical protein